MAKKKLTRHSEPTDPPPAKASRKKVSEATISKDDAQQPDLNAPPQPHAVQGMEIIPATKEGKGPVAKVRTTQVQPNGKNKAFTFTREYPEGTALEQITNEINTHKFRNELWEES